MTCRIDISKTPFSKYGSYLAVCYDSDKKCLTIHNAHRRFGQDHIFTLTFEKDGRAVDFSVAAAPYVVNVKSSAGNARIYMRGDNAIVIDSYGLGFHLKMETGKPLLADSPEVYPASYGVQEGARRFKMIRVDAQLYSAVDVLQGVAVAQGPYDQSPGGNQRDRRIWLRVDCENQRALANVEISHLESKPGPIALDTEADIAEVKSQWREFLAKMPDVSKEYRAIAQTSWFNLWASVVRAKDCYKYDAMVMSKKFMSSVWSWDHCFNALAVAPANLKMAIEQFLLPFELQEKNGVLPDLFNPHNEIIWGVTKPPIHGWCFGILMSKYQIDKPVLRKVYGHLEKWTNWWMQYRDSDQDGIPDYPQGCDSGWDNSTLFDIGYFLESPDLSAYLVLQMKALAEIARRLGRVRNVQSWNQRANTLLTRLYEHSWDGNQFVAKLSRSHEYSQNQTSLLALMPLVLGELLDKDKFAKLVNILESDFLTENGPATEAIKSPHYQSDSYWRGPIWAPTTYLLVDGLRRGGRGDLAEKVATGFCNMIKDKAGGNYENFDAITGKGLRAPGYTWTASVNLLLIREYL